MPGAVCVVVSKSVVGWIAGIGRDGLMLHLSTALS